MDKAELKELLRQVAEGSLSPEDAALKLKMEPIREVGDYAKVDMHRASARGFPRSSTAREKRRSRFSALPKPCSETDRKRCS